MRISILTTGEIAEHARRLERLQVKARQLRKELKANALEQKAIKRTLKEQDTHDEWTEAHAGPGAAMKQGQDFSRGTPTTFGAAFREHVLSEHQAARVRAASDSDGVPCTCGHDASDHLGTRDGVPTVAGCNVPECKCADFDPFVDSASLSRS